MNSFELDEQKLKCNKEFIYLAKDELPPKVQAICKSVISLYNSGTVFSKMTISEIAKHAGIGKGTVYEYFESKEEIIITAMLIELKGQLDVICEAILSKESFSDKYDTALIWIVEHMKSNVVLQQLLITRYAESSHEAVCALVNNMLQHTKSNLVLESIMETGVREGVFVRPVSLIQEKAAYATFVYGSVALLKPEEFGNPSQEEIITYCRKLFIQILNPITA